MKALNHSEITQKYLTFLAYFSVLLFFSVSCGYFFNKTCEAQTNALLVKKNDYDFAFRSTTSLSVKIDSLNLLLKLVNTGKVGNEQALEKAILALNNETSIELDHLEQTQQGNYTLYRKFVLGVANALDGKKSFQSILEEEKTLNKKLNECRKANEKVEKSLLAN
jgi:hypothetical protein